MLTLKKKQQKTISDKISELLAPQQLLDPEVDSADETTAKSRRYDTDEEDDDDPHEIDLRLSDIRKKNIKLLQDVDPKYGGYVSSRKNDHSDDDNDDGVNDNDDDEDDDAYEDSSDDEKAVASFSNKLKQLDASEDEDSEKEEGFDEEADSDSDAENATGTLLDDENAAETLLDDSDDDESGTGDLNDDSENDDDEDNEDGSDEDESDFDGGDVDISSATQTKNQNITMKPSNKNLDILKGFAVQNQLQLWEKLLEVRIHSQKVLLKANSLPHFEKMETLAENSEEFSAMVNKTSENVERLLGKMCEMQSILIGQYPETKDLITKKKRKLNDNSGGPVTKLHKYSQNITDNFNDYKDYRDSVILKWYDRTKVLTPGTKEAKSSNSFNILQTIQGVLANREDLIKKTQLYKGGYEICGQRNVAATAPTNFDDQPIANEETKEEVYSEEIYDDTDFYHTQLRELIEFKANTSNNPTEMTKQFIELQKLRKKMKKAVDTRASKGRKIRYVVHNKMVNFMARNDPSEWTDDAKSELYSSLFGARMQ